MNKLFVCLSLLVESMNKIIGISGVAGSGKDTFVELLSNFVFGVKRYALADRLREEMKDFIREKFYIDVFNCSQEQKNLIRPLLVSYSLIKRTMSNGKYLTSYLENKIFLETHDCKSIIPCITDIRRDDEVSWLKNRLNGILVYIEKYNIVNSKVTKNHYPNNEEATNDPKLRLKANFRIRWPQALQPDGSLDKKILIPYVEKFIKFLQQN